MVMVFFGEVLIVVVGMFDGVFVCVMVMMDWYLLLLLFFVLDGVWFEFIVISCIVLW